MGVFNYLKDGKRRGKMHERQGERCERMQRHWLNKYIIFLLNANSSALICT